MTNFALVVFVFCIGFGWGAAMILLFCYRDLKRILKYIKDSMDLSRKILSFDDDTRKKLSIYVELTHKSFSACIEENQKIVNGLQKLVDAVKEEGEREGFQ